MLEDVATVYGGDGWTLKVGDCVAGLAAMDAGSVDFLFADPPYNMRLGSATLTRPDQSDVRAVDDEWDKFASYQVYDSFTRAWAAQAKRVLGAHGTMMVIGSYHNVYRVGAVLEELGFWTLNDIVWSKPNPMPNFKGTRLANAHETILWVATSEKARFAFNYEALKEANDGKQLGSVWQIPICGGSERLRGEDGERLHSTQKPEALLSRALAVATRPGSRVCDPFTGSGTTGAVARRMGRSFIGFEREAGYAAIAAERISGTSPPPDRQVALPVSRREAVKVSFLQVIGLGLIKPGELIVTRGGEAVVRDDGLVFSQAAGAGSIHKVGALVNGVPACNGWDAWTVRREGGDVPIDDLRAKAREILAKAA